jgi:NADH dehydrogenase [ubiquinone] 1 alpha subcomplex assembly factor 1
MQPVDDRVMGGRSASRFRATGEGTGVFEGIVSRENGGGFASVRCGIPNTDLGMAPGVLLRVRGDGHRYRLSLRNDRRLSGVNYLQGFHPPKDEWAEIHLPFAGFRASLRGRTPPDAPPLNPRRIRQVGLMIADGQEGPFQLELAWIRAWDGR